MTLSHDGDRAVADPSRRTVTVVLGAGGLLGGAVARAVDRDARLLRLVAPPVPWSRPDEAVRVLADVAREVAGRERWQVLWCAGAGVTGMTPAAGETELAVFRAFAQALGAVASPGAGTLFVASSAGGVLAGSAPAPFDEGTVAAPLSEYGRVKLRLEDAARELATTSDVAVLVGRYANLYGPGQDLGKQQGLVSHLCLGAIERRPVSIFVPLDTLRDYLFVDDAARRTLVTLDAFRASGLREATKIFASGTSSTVATVIGRVAAAVGRRPPIVLGSSPLTSLQARDLRMTSRVLTEADVMPTTPLGTGIAATHADLFRRFVASGRRHH